MAVFLEHRKNFFLTDLTFQIKTWREMVLYAPQPFVDLSHGVGLNTRPLGYAARTGSPDRSPQMLIGLNSHFTFNALPDLEVFISGVVPSNKNAVQMPENGSVVFFEQADKVMKSEMYFCLSPIISKPGPVALCLPQCQTILACIANALARPQPQLWRFTCGGLTARLPG